MNFSDKEKEILEFWEQNDIFQKSIEKPGGRKSKGDFVFYDGPPFATGLPHYGHLVAGTIKDVIPRFKTMQGYRVKRRWGWDCHGLPIENIVEKEKGIESKKDIEKDIDAFNKACRDTVLRYRKEWKDIVERTGRWVDMESDYRTMDNKYIEVIWWIFKQLYDEGLIYEGYKSMHLCPRCETTLSNFEVTLGYKEVKDIGVTVKFKVKNPQLRIKHGEQGSDVYLLAWTTTPWTLPGNMALAVGNDIKYALWKNEKGDYFITSEDWFENHYGEFSPGLKRRKPGEPIDGSFGEKVGELKGKDLIGLEYEPLFDFIQAEVGNIDNAQNAFQVYSAPFVSTEEGTGVVHIAPAFGEDDYILSKENAIPFLQHVNTDGTFKSYVKPFSGLKVRFINDDHKTDIEIIKYLSEHKLLFAKNSVRHSYPHCWRCDSPLLNYASASWFVRVTKLKDRLRLANKKVRWVPDHIQEGRFGKWLEGARDWAISRSRFWGAPIPVWRCEKEECRAIRVVGSQKELKQEIEDLHRPFIDEVSLPCHSCSGEMKRIAEVFDCWFESGSMPYASELIFSDYEISPTTRRVDLQKQISFPAHFIAEGIDQTRGWFYTLMVLGVALYNKSPFQNCVVNGIILAENGQKMSKRLKNYPDPTDIMNRYGADALRFYLMNSPAVRGESLNFSEKGVDEVYKKVILLMQNVVNFWKLHAHKIDVDRYSPKHNNVLDHWINDYLEKTLDGVTDALDNYEIDKACRFITDFINNLSTWYVRRSRNRFQRNDFDMYEAVENLGFVLHEFSKILAPIAPFLAEYIYQETRKEKTDAQSVHLDIWSEPIYRVQSVRKGGLDTNFIVDDNTRILRDMERVRSMCQLGHNLRRESSLKVRQVLSRFQIEKSFLPLECPDRIDEYINLIKDELNIKKVVMVETMSKNHGWLVKDGVALYTILDDSLKEEGLVRELARKINFLRKKQGLTIQDHITLAYSTESNELKQVVERNKGMLKKAVLAKEIIEGSNVDGAVIMVEGTIVQMFLEK